MHSNKQHFMFVVFCWVGASKGSDCIIAQWMYPVIRMWQYWSWLKFIAIIDEWLIHLTTDIVQFQIKINIMASNASFLRQGSSLLRSISTVNRPIVMAQTKSLSSLTKAITCPQFISRVSNITRVRCMATEGDKQLATFLQEEIQSEKKNARPLPKLDGWSVKTDGSEVKLTRVGASAGEQVQITLNVNHTVDSAQPDDGTGEVR